MLAVFNFAEGLFWLLLALAAVGRGFWGKRHSGIYFIGGGVLFAFGISDFVEIHTGAWWSPWWLALWKIACVAAGGFCAWWLWRRRRNKS